VSGPLPTDPAGTAGRSDPAGTTGHDGVDGVLADLAEVAALAPAEQITLFEDAHQRLSAALRGVDDD
jgi:hypothetical protein